jgi:hypothetical protein
METPIRKDWNIWRFIFSPLISEQSIQPIRCVVSPVRRQSQMIGHLKKQSFIQALYHLAAHQECIELLREEIEDVVSREGWTKSAMGEMRGLDSFLKESQRLTGLAAGGC